MEVYVLGPKVVPLTKNRKAVSFTVLLKDSETYSISAGWRVLGGLITPPYMIVGKKPYTKYIPVSCVDRVTAVAIYEAIKAANWPELAETEPLLNDPEIVCVSFCPTTAEIAVRYPEVVPKLSNVDPEESVDEELEALLAAESV